VLCPTHHALLDEGRFLGHVTTDPGYFVLGWAGASVRNGAAHYLLNAWRESPLYTDRERAALGWTESLTLVSQTHAPDADYEALQGHFSKEEVVKLTLAISTINAWNRIAIGFQSIHPVASRGDAA
jgi:hypothetical protein